MLWLLWILVQVVWHWLARHWYLDVLAVAVAVGVGWAALTRRVARERDRRERLSRLRYSLEQIDTMSPREFELACAALLHRDGFEAEHVGGSNDQAADVIARDRIGRIVVVQCKHTTRAAKVSAPVLYTVNGTARPAHGADIVIVATNGGFTSNAREWAPRHDIHLIDRARLAHWASDGHVLHAVLGISPPPAGRGGGR